MSLTAFFKKVSKEEYLKKAEETNAHTVLVTEAQVHSPVPTNSAEVTPRSRIQSGKRRDSNVARAESETDSIEVIDVVSADAGDEAAAAAPAKISASLFKKRNRERLLEEEAPGSDDVASDEVDFFREAAAAIEAEMGDEENVTPEKEVKTAAAAVEQDKISMKLFANKRGKKREKPVAPQPDDDSVDFDFLQTTSKRQREEEEEKTGETNGADPMEKEEEEEKSPSPELFKPRRSKRRRKIRSGLQEQNYDSDSLDVEVLSAMSERAFNKRGKEDEEKAFNVLMKKPLVGGYGKKKREKEEDKHDDDDDDIKVEKVVLSPLRKRAASSAKLAPIFIRGKKANPIKVIEGPEQVAARKAFLMSSAPKELRPNRGTCGGGAGDSSMAARLADHPPLPKVSHVNQKSDEDGYWRLPVKELKLLPPRSKELPNCQTREGIGLYSELTVDDLSSGGPDTCGLSDNVELKRMSALEVYSFVRDIDKAESGGFPVRKVFGRLVERKLESDAIVVEAQSKNLVSALISFNYMKS